MGQEAQQVWCDVKQNEAMMSALLPIKEKERRHFISWTG